MQINKKPTNEQGQAHGYWEMYFSNGELLFKGNCLNGIKYGCWQYNFLGNNPYIQYHAR
jgi:antitoxin component YwqK of YwqJK toxin-antitoxin module